MADFVVADIAGVRIVEGTPGAAMLARGRDVSRLVEACINARARAALL